MDPKRQSYQQHGSPGARRPAARREFSLPEKHGQHAHAGHRQPGDSQRVGIHVDGTHTGRRAAKKQRRDQSLRQGLFRFQEGAPDRGASGNLAEGDGPYYRA